MTPLVSILITCHDAARWVDEAVESALAQTWPKIEVVVVNDGSTDGSGEVLERYQNRGVRVIHQENKGQCAAANRAFAESAGAYIKFFDADDLLDPEMITLQLARLTDQPLAIASAEWGRFYNDDLSTFQPSSQSVWCDMDAREWLVEAWRDAQPMMQCALWLIPRALLDRSGLWDESLSLINDFEFFARVLCQASEVRFTPGARLYYRSGLEGSLSRSINRAAVESAFRSLLDGTNALLCYRQDVEARLSCANVLQNFIYTFYPDHPDLLSRISNRVKELGGSNLAPVGPPRFHQMRRFTGWKFARRVQRFASQHGYRADGSGHP